MRNGVWKRLSSTFVALALLCVIPAVGAARIDVLVGGRVMPVAYLVMSVVTYALYHVDKERARRGEWRIAEGSLHLCEVLCGWPGAFVAQQVLHHKNRKLPYQVAFWGIVALHQVGWLAVLDREGLVH